MENQTLGCRIKILHLIKELYRSNDVKPFSENKFYEIVETAIEGSRFFIILTRICQFNDCESVTRILLKLLQHCWERDGGHPMVFFEFSIGIISLWHLYEEYKDIISIHEFIELMDHLKYTPFDLNRIGRCFMLRAEDVSIFHTSIIMPIISRKHLLEAVWETWQIDHIEYGNNSYLQWLPEEVMKDVTALI